MAIRNVINRIRARNFVGQAFPYPGVGRYGGRSAITGRRIMNRPTAPANTGQTIIKRPPDQYNMTTFDPRSNQYVDIGKWGQKKRTSYRPTSKPPLNQTQTFKPPGATPPSNRKVTRVANTYQSSKVG